MKRLLILLLLNTLLFGGDIVLKSSSVSVDETIARIKTIVEEKGMTVFAIIDHQKNAEQVNMSLASSKLIIFGNPKMGTRLMQKNLESGLDLPIRILVFKDNTDGVKIAYRQGTWLDQEHGLHLPELTQKMNSALDNITSKAAQ